MILSLPQPRSSQHGYRIKIMAEWQERISSLAAGVHLDEILTSYPALTDADIQAALSYAAELAREGTAALPLERIA